MDLFRRSSVARANMCPNWLLLLLVSSTLAASSGTPLTNTDSLCIPADINTNPVQCFCTSNKGTNNLRSADCYINKPGTLETDESWERFDGFNTERITFTNTRGITMKYIPTNAIKHLQDTVRIDVQYSIVKEILPYAFANISSVREISLSGNHIEQLHSKAFANHRYLTVLNLDKNKLTEINASVFDNLPSLEKLFLTSNKISIIHEKAFIGLHALKDLELDKNEIFTLSNDAFVGLKSLLRLELSYNSLQVIGEYTFKSLSELEYLDLEGNKIEILGDYAFAGLDRLVTLSLAMNNIRKLDSKVLFTHTPLLSVLSVKGNNMTKLEGSVLTPIIKHFYKTYTKFDFEDNLFPCDCGLEWFLELRNSTKNENLKLSIDNLKCVPDEELQEQWAELNDNTNVAESREEADDPTSGEYEYYDERQLGGKLFYTDIRESLLHCNTKPRDSTNSVERTRTDKTRTEKTRTEKQRTEKPRNIQPVATQNAVDEKIKAASGEKSFLGNRGVLVLTDEDGTEEAKGDANNQQAQAANFFKKNDDNMSSDDPSDDVNSRRENDRRSNSSCRVVGSIITSIMFMVSLVFN